MDKQYSRLVEYFKRIAPGEINLDEDRHVVGSWRLTDYGPFHMIVQCLGTEHDHVMFSVRRIMSVPVESKQKALKFINLLNWQSLMGNFEMDQQDGELSFRMSYCLCGSEITEEQFSHGFNLAMENSIKYYPAFQKLFWNDISPEEILKSVLEENGESEEASDQVANIPENYAEEVIEEIMEVLKKDSVDERGV